MGNFQKMRNLCRADFLLIFDVKINAMGKISNFGKKSKFELSLFFNFR